VNKPGDYFGKFRCKDCLPDPYAACRYIQIIIFPKSYGSLNGRQTVGGDNGMMKIHRLGGSPQQRRQRTIDLLERVGLGEVMNQLPHEFSGGQRVVYCTDSCL